ncbi:fumarylacetoacetate hydrolase family protein [Penicillium malachiteum]|uniref:Fumarylacetoacetate hydrolase family protein n=1 Tax=Penicillium malachiteum TaxID=1324776 RepID=A0AAD6HNB0_9EURO|nr:fumarylacetoacetate hydrolase family protein [Penicillium malachiteum]
MRPVFERLVRFKDTDQNILYGEAPTGIDDLVGQTVTVYRGDIPWDLQPTTEHADIAEVLCPLVHTPIIYGVGLNYKAHIAEGPKANAPLPPYPVISTKPADSINGPFSPVYVSSKCADTIDYEGELTLVLGRDCKDVTTVAEALDSILGYTVGNDFSCRQWQRPDISGGQHGYAKSFDGFAPFGPVLVAPSLLPIDETSSQIDLELITRVNGEERQRGRTSDMILNIGEIIMHLSRATTLRQGTVIMTGTPEGVALSMKPPAWVCDGDEVEVIIEGLGSIKNKYCFIP